MPLEDLLNKVAALKGLTGIQRAGRPTGPGRRTHQRRTWPGCCAKRGRRHRQAGAGRWSAWAARRPGAGARDLVREIAVQLARNAVVHGIESPPTARPRARTSRQGDVQLVRNETDWTLSVRDDGRRPVGRPVRAARLLELGWYTARSWKALTTSRSLPTSSSPASPPLRIVTPACRPRRGPGRGAGQCAAPRRPDDAELHARPVHRIPDPLRR
jgi:two-component system chemotaxis sensor kinase CheA